MSTRILHRRGIGIPSADDFSSVGEILIDTETGTGYTLRETDGAVVALGGDGSGSGTGAGMVISPTEPADPVDGMQWLESTTARVWVWDEGKWLEFPAAGGSGAGEIIIDGTEPENPAEGSQWFNSEDGYLYIQYQGQWVAIGGAGGSGGGDGGGSNSSDPYWNNVELQLRFKDITQPWQEDAKDRVVTPVGDAIISGEEFKHPSFSLTINKDGKTNHGLEVDEFRAGHLTGLWTAEAWIYPINSAGTAGTSKRTILAGSKDNTGSDSSFRIFQYGDNFQFTVRGYDGTQNVNIVSAGDKAALGEWQHIAISNDGNLYRVFHNGKLLMTEVSVSANQTEARYIEVGRSIGNNAKAFSGYIDDVRITDRICRYTTDFEPPGELPTAGTRSLMLEQKGGDNDADLS